MLAGEQISRPVSTPPATCTPYSFTQRDWATHFAKRDEVENYLRRVADEYRVRDAIRFNTEVVSAEFDPRSARWTVRTYRGDELSARILISATGVLNRPKIPSIPGRESFEGPAFHTAEWPDGLDLSGKRVAVIGTGASAMQVVPAIAGEVESLWVFQRSPQWIAPNNVYFSAIDPAVHRLMARVPFYARWYRARLAWNFSAGCTSLQSTLTGRISTGPSTPRTTVTASLHPLYREREVTGRDRRCCPTIRRSAGGCSSTAVGTPRSGARTCLVTGGHPDRSSWCGASSTRPVDVVVFATGFHTHRYLYPMRIAGRSDGRWQTPTRVPERARLSGNHRARPQPVHSVGGTALGTVAASSPSPNVR